MSMKSGQENEEAAWRPTSFLWSLSLQTGPSSSSRGPGGKVENRSSFFPLFQAAHAGAVGRHFHGPTAPLSERRRKRRLYFASSQQSQLGGAHLARIRGVAHGQRLSFQLHQTHTRLEILLDPLQRFRFLQRRPIVFD